MNEELLHDLDHIKAILVKGQVASQPAGGGFPDAAALYSMLYAIDHAREFVEALRNRVAHGEE